MKTLRIWPAVVFLIFLVALQVVPSLWRELSFPMFILTFTAPMVCALGMAIWWLFASRATWTQRLLGGGITFAACIASILIADPTMRSLAFPIFVLPTGVSSFALTAILLTWWGRRAPNLDSSLRSGTAIPAWSAVTIGSLGFLAWAAVRSDGIDGSFKTELRWRWTPTAEARYLELLKTRPAAAKASSPADGDATGETIGDTATDALGEILWPRFRGPNGDSVIRDVVLDSAWKETPPRELWRIPIGPGWSSFVVAGNRLFTQEQREDHEVTLCLDAASGAELWTHGTQDAERFWEPVAGTGPRATPTLHEEMLFVLGATGILERLDPRTGKSVWLRDLRKDAQRSPPTWGFSSSPLIIGSNVVVHAGGADGKGILAYDIDSGELRWQARAGDHSYSSPHRARLGDQEFVLMLTNNGLTAVDPESGEIAWEHSWEYQGYRVVQPLIVDGSSILLGTGMDTGTMRIDVSRKDSEGNFYECWLSPAMRPDFNDYVAHRGHLYGFDRNMFASIDLETGKRNWKGGRYGNGQALLLSDADQILVLSETGELVLLEANPKRLTELARQKILSGKTWNHPVLIGDKLYARNGEEAVAYALPMTKRSAH